MSTKRSTPFTAEPRPVKKRQLVTNDSIAALSSADSVSSRTRSRNRKDARSNGDNQVARSLSSSTEKPLAMLFSAAEVVQDPTPSSDNLTPFGAQPPFASNSGAEETTTGVVSLSGFSSLGDLTGVETQSIVPDYLPTPSPLLAPLPIALGSARAYVSLQSSPPLLPTRPVPPATTRRKLKKPTMAFKYAIFRIVSNEDYCTWIKWSEDGERLLIGSWDFLIDTLIDLGFGATERTSVMKNFYSYGFKLESDGRCRVPDDAGREWTILHHNNFQRGHPELLKDIKRAVPPPRRR